MKAAVANVTRADRAADRLGRPRVADLGAGRRRRADAMRRAAHRCATRQAGRRSWGARLVVLVPYLWLAVLLPRAVPDRAQDQPVADRDRAAALYAGVRSRRRLAGLEAILRRAVARQLRAARLRLALSRVLSASSLEIAAVSTAILLADRLSARLRHGARAARAGRPVLFMLVVLPFWTSFLIRIYAWINILQRDGLLNQVLLALGIVDDAAGLALDRHRGLYRHRLFLSAVHGAADLRDAREDGRDAARGRRRSRLPALEGVLAGDAAAVAAGRDRRRAAVLHPDRRRVRHPRSARRLRDA